MASVTAKPSATIVYNGRNVSQDVNRFLLAVTYTDRVAGKSDEIELRFDDTDGRWRTTWAPTKGDKVAVTITDGIVTINCGTFEVDEIEYEGPPDVLMLRAIAAGTSKAVRTKKNTAHEAKTLKQIAQAVATANGLTLQGDIENITIARSTQWRETDLGFLRRIAEEYGYVFSIRDTVMTFVSVYELEAAKPALVVEYTDLVKYSVRSKTEGTYKSTKVASRNPKTNKVVQQDFTGSSADNADGIPFSQTVAGDVQVINTKTEDAGQAERKAKAAHHKANSKEVTANIEVNGNPIMVAGNNFELLGVGVFSGVFHILESRHTLSRDKYTTTLEAKKVATVSSDGQARVNDDPVPSAQIAAI